MYEEEMPVFIKIENYKEVIELLHVIKSKVKEARNYLDRVYSLKDEEDAKINEWNDIVAELDKKVNFINSTLMEPKV